ncbi:hypothetical protein HPP92_013319 [Vanilla planifolia]|uniref:Uncharacterized protein n=1 Tax=Vanilla planifolia TaxID=51239 RepID=A0A835QXZ0_VANPL|nr:hypothetical protein HPP92_013319 [Vanilla planifolia]
MSVVGFDVGNDNSVIAVVKQRGIDVPSMMSPRVRPRGGLFGEKQSPRISRCCVSPMNTKSTISQIKRPSAGTSGTPTSRRSPPP